MAEQKESPVACEGCKKEIASEKVRDFSKRNFGKQLCMECQEAVKKNQPIAPPAPQAQNQDPETGIPEKYQKYVKELQGKKFITHAGLLAIAHDTGLVSIKTELIQADMEKKFAIVRADVMMRVKEGKDSEIFQAKEFTGLGDSTQTNTGKMVAEHFVRMAETRAVARALRLATNVGLTSVEEISDEDRK